MGLLKDESCLAQDLSQSGVNIRPDDYDRPPGRKTELAFRPFGRIGKETKSCRVEASERRSHAERAEATKIVLAKRPWSARFTFFNLGRCKSEAGIVDDPFHADSLYKGSHAWRGAFAEATKVEK